MFTLPLTRYDMHLLNERKLTDTDFGMAPWELVWMLEQIHRTPGHILEIGTNRGGTARQIALAFPRRQLFCVDICDPAYGLSLDQIGEKSKALENVKLVIQDSKTYVYPDGVGVVFIDGDHTWEGVKSDTEKALAHFRANRGIIIWHDYSQDFEVMPYLEWLRQNNQLDIRHVQFTTTAYLKI